MQTRPLIVPMLFLAAAFTGCVQERAPINRVQPYYLNKELFVGKDLADPKDDPEFYSHAALIDVGYGASQDGLFTSTYAQPMSRMKWQLTEDLLIGRLSYERIQGSDGKGLGKQTNDGVIACAFKITSHFDIKHAYNSTTGEELNVLEENGVDRPWYQRQYFRADFSKNLNVDSYDFDTLSMMGIYGGIKYEALAIEIDDPSDENAPYFSEDGTYFDITSKAFAKPGLIDLASLGWGDGTFPACFLPGNYQGTAPAGSCNPIEITVRHAFRRVVDHDFEPKEWDGFRFQAFGGFTSERYGYARNYGMTDDRWYRFLDHYNIWDKSHYYDAAGQAIPCFTKKTGYGADPNADADKDGTADECKAVTVALGGIKGSQCDTFSQKCTLPMQERTSRPVVWYYTSGSQPEYFSPTEDAAHEWDVAMRGAVMSGKYAACKSVGDKDCAKRFPMYTGQQDDHDDVIALAKEVDDCRHGIAYKSLNRDEEACVKLADTVGAARRSQPGVIALAKQAEMVVMCHSPVETNDPAVCAPADQRLDVEMTAEMCDNYRRAADRKNMAKCTTNKAGKTVLQARRGDLRYHQINAVVEPQTPSPWGIMVDSHDPTTGETVSASINIWTYINELWSQGVIDQSRYIAGELKTEDITSGKYIHDWSQAAKAASTNGLLPLLTAEQVQQKMADSGAKMTPEQSKKFEEKNPQAAARVAEVAEQLAGVKASNDAPSAHTPMYLARRQSATGTQFEAALMTPMLQAYAGIVGQPMSQGLMDMVSPLRGGNPGFERQLRQMRDAALAERGACVMEQAPAPLAIAGLADVLQKKFGNFNPQDSKDVQQARAEKMRKYLARRVQYAVIIHEMGHSIGLRHNFVSSADAWSYRPQYWQLRTNNGAVSKACASLQSQKNAESCVGPRYFDPVTDNERNNLIWMFMQSSVMDYAGEATQDMIGLGAYDFAAARLFYGDTVAVHADDSYKSTTARGQGSLAKTDNFGGILGLTPKLGTKDIHYSQLQKDYELISKCTAVDAKNFIPARWDKAIDGDWNALIDGLIVTVNGETTRCRQQAVDYVQWPSLAQLPGGRAGPAVDPDGRTRVPYGFATDRWADLGNASVYRHDNGADQYEIFNFFITQQEVGHIFDNYRRGKTTFNVKAAADRTLTRFNEKLRDGAKGLGLYRNIYRDVALEAGINPDDLWAYAAFNFFPQPMLASGMVFDHFARMEARPEPGEHYLDGKVLRSMDSKQSNKKVTTVLKVPNGATGFYGNVAFGGRPVENALADDKGEYDSEYTMNAGSYYDKMYVAMLFTESVDNFISSSLGDFTDARYRSVSLADLFPEGYRRFLSNALTNDDEIKGPRIAADANGKLITDVSQYPVGGMGWTSWWGDSPAHCFPGEGSTICHSYGVENSKPFAQGDPAKVVALDPQIGWEQQKFLIAWTMLYLPENQQQNWMDMLRIWELGVDSDPKLDNARMEFHYPGGKDYVAHTYGKEEIFGKVVQKGIAARVLEYANSLLVQAYETTPGADIDGDGTPDWYLPVVDPTSGQVRVKYDAGVTDANGGHRTGCDKKDNSKCTCMDNVACVRLQQYVEVPYFLRESVTAYRLGLPEGKGFK